MREKLCEFSSHFKQLDQNYEFLRKTRQVLAEEARLSSKPDLSKKMIEDNKIIDCLSTLAKGFLQLQRL